MKQTTNFQIGQTYEGYGEVKGIRFTLLSRKGNTCLFSRSDGYFEIIELRQQEASSAVMGDTTIEFKEKEIYPSGNSWSGKCIRDGNRAKHIFEQSVG